MKTLYLGNNNKAEIISSNSEIRNILSQKLNTQNEEMKDDAFFVADLSDIIKKYQDWCSLLPSIEPFYAVKCNDDSVVVQTLANLGTSFDCASKNEIKKVLAMGIEPSRIIYANPCKQVSHIKYAAQNGIEMMTFDNEDELYKVKRAYPSAKLVLRLLPGDFKSQCNLGIKFGCHPQHVLKLLKIAKELELNIIGISFHVGSGCQDPKAFPAAIALARTAFDQAISIGYHPYLLDIGGGFPGYKNGPVSFNEICDGINSSLMKHFPPSSNVRIIAEPGRYFVASAFTLAVNVIAKRVVSRDSDTNSEAVKTEAICNTVEPTKNDEPAYMYYVNDGVYGSFNCILYDHQTVSPSLLEEVDVENEYSSSIWGPTCDSMDCIMNHCMLPELEVGDWLVFENMGAYTVAAASNFNGIPKPSGAYVIRESNVDLVRCNNEEKTNNTTVKTPPKKKASNGPCLELPFFECVIANDDPKSTLLLKPKITTY